MVIVVVSRYVVAVAVAVSHVVNASNASVAVSKEALLLVRVYASTDAENGLTLSSSRCGSFPTNLSCPLRLNDRKIGIK